MWGIQARCVVADVPVETTVVRVNDVFIEFVLFVLAGDEDIVVVIAAAVDVKTEDADGMFVWNGNSESGPNSTGFVQGFERRRFRHMYV